MDYQRFLDRQRLRRRYRVRNHLKGKKGVLRRPRLSVYRSNKHIYAQVIDDSGGRTLASASTREPVLLNKAKNGGNKDAAVVIGKAIAERSLAAGVKEVAFDRGSYKFHGRVAALAKAAREGGLVF
jgi:large subunit ribosomal protein L18